MQVVAHGLLVLGARFDGDDVGDLVLQRYVPGGGEADGLRENGGLSGAGDAVERFVPPIVGGDVEAREGGRGVLHLQDLFVEGHARDQVGGALLGGEVGVEVGRGVGGLADQGTAKREAGCGGEDGEEFGRNHAGILSWNIAQLVVGDN